ncbi:MAG: helix-turn-helix transcriptional regulator [Actinomycetes bacterium]
MSGTWTFLTNHAHVLLLLGKDPDLRLRDLAMAVGITERAAQRIVTELIEGGYVSRERVGRRNTYTVHPDIPLRHPLEHGSTIGDLLASVEPDLSLTQTPTRP